MKREQDPVASWARRESEKHAEYIYNQREWMKYPQAVDANAALGSGPVEAACKTLVTQRLKVSGASWSRDGAAGVLYLRLAHPVRPLRGRLCVQAGDPSCRVIRP